MKEIVKQRVAEELLKGINTLGEVVGSTLGPEGRNVMIDHINGIPHVTKDGVTVARSIAVADRVQNMGIQLVKQAAQQTAKEAGDGTTTSTVLAQSICYSGFAAMTNKKSVNPIKMRKGMMQAVEDVTKYIKSVSRECTSKDDLFSVALVSSNYNEEIAMFVSDVKHAIGDNGQILYQPAPRTETSVDVISGMRIESRIYSDMMATTLKRKARTQSALEIDNPLVFVMDYEVISNNDVVSLMKDCLNNHPGRPVLILCDAMEGEPLATINNTNTNTERAFFAVARNPFAREKGALMVDMSTYLGATLITESSGLKPKDVTSVHAGNCRKIIFRDNDIVFIDPQPSQESQIQDRVRELKALLLSHQPDSAPFLEIKNRLASLTGAIGIISVGASTPSELEEKLDIYDDVIHAVESAFEEGVVYGGGNTLAHAKYALSSTVAPNNDFELGYSIVIHALTTPIEHIIKNAGHEKFFDALQQRLLLNGVAHIQNGEVVFSDTPPSFLLDPAKVVRVALRNAVTVASTVLTTEYLVVLTEDYIKEVQQLTAKR
jgi:chaperonin GroEL